MALLDPDEVVAMYADFADDYNDTVLKEYKYTAHSVIPSFLICKLAKMPRSETLKVLDLGCGTGLSALEFFKKPPERKQAGENSFAVWGVDLSAAMLERAKRLPYQQLTCANIEEAGGLPFDRRFFDVVVMIGVLEFIHDLSKMFSAVKNVLKPGGWFGFAVPNKLPRKQEVALSIRSYETSEVTAAVEAAGFIFSSAQTLSAYLVGKTQVMYTVMYCQLASEKPQEELES